MLTTLASPGGRRGRLTILIYHQVLDGKDPWRPSEIDSGVFDWQMRIVANQFNVLPLAEAIERLRSGSLPARAAAISFDDGYADNVRNALPILRRYGLSATFFIASSFLRGGCMWNDSLIEGIGRTRVNSLDLSADGIGMLNLGGNDQKTRAMHVLIKALKHMEPRQRQAKVEQVCGLADVSSEYDLMMNERQVRELVAGGMDIGGHTVSHPILSSLAATEAEAEISKGKSDLEAIISSPIKLFAYPNGTPGQDYTNEHVSMVKKAGFTGAVSTCWGAGSVNSDFYQLPRFTPWDRTSTRFSLRLLGNYFNLWDR